MVNVLADDQERSAVVSVSEAQRTPRDRSSSLQSQQGAEKESMSRDIKAMKAMISSLVKGMETLSSRVTELEAEGKGKKKKDEAKKPLADSPPRSTFVSLDGDELQRDSDYASPSEEEKQDKRPPSRCNAHSRSPKKTEIRYKKKKETNF